VVETHIAKYRVKSSHAHKNILLSPNLQTALLWRAVDLIIEESMHIFSLYIRLLILLNETFQCLESLKENQSVLEILVSAL
jgi:hypothetical protein